MCIRASRSKSSVFKQEQPLRYKLNAPWLRLRVQCSPKVFRHICLQVRLVPGLRLSMEMQIERHLMRGFTGADKPAGKAVFAARFRPEYDLMRAHAEMRQPIRHRYRRLQIAVPRSYGNAIAGNATRGNNVLAAGEPRGNNSLRALEELMLRAAGDHPTAVEHQQVSAEPEGFFHVVGDKHHGAAIIGQGFANMFLYVEEKFVVK